MAIWPPSASPRSAVRSEPTASITLRTSSIHCSRVGSAASGTGSDTPVPRLSKQRSRLKVARRRRKRASDGSSHMTSTLLPQFGTNTRSRGPLPTTWYATWPSLLVAYRVSTSCMAALSLPLGLTSWRRAAGVGDPHGTESRVCAGLLQRRVSWCASSVPVHGLLRVGAEGSPEPILHLGARLLLHRGGNV